MKLSEIKLNPSNPRIIKDDKFKKLVQSLKDFPKMMALRPIIIDETGTIQGGNMRYKALKELGHTEVPDEWIKQGKDLTAEQWREFVVKDNVGFGEWDWDELANNWDAEKLTEWGVDIPNFEPEAQKDLSDTLKTGFKIEVDCVNENEQELLYNKLTEEGYECRLLTL